MIYIPTKGRPTQKLFSMLPEATLVVEPQEEAAYRQANPNHAVVVLPENNRGITYVRNHILNMATEHFWMIDDDVTTFKINSKAVPFAEIDKIIREYVAKNPIVGQAAPEYDQYSWSASPDKKISFNSYCDVAVYVDPRVREFAQYDATLPLKVDRDFTMQLIRAGRAVARFSHLSFVSPKNGSNKGGLYDEYKVGFRERDAVMAMIKKWPHCVTPQVKKDGRFDCKIDWNKVRG